MSAVEWLIIGGGIHGVHLAACLQEKGKVSHDAIRIIDDQSKLLATWKRCSKATGMQYLRSPSVHHLGMEPFELKQYAKRRIRKSPLNRYFAAPYERPALSLFQEHCDHVIERNDLAALRMQDRV